MSTITTKTNGKTKTPVPDAVFGRVTASEFCVPYPDGRPAIVLRVTEHGPEIEVLDKKGVARVHVGIGFDDSDPAHNGDPRIMLTDPEGYAGVHVYVDSDTDTPRLIARDPHCASECTVTPTGITTTCTDTDGDTAEASLHVLPEAGGSMARLHLRYGGGETHVTSDFMTKDGHGNGIHLSEEGLQVHRART